MANLTYEIEDQDWVCALSEEVAAGLPSELEVEVDADYHHEPADFSGHIDGWTPDNSTLDVGRVQVDLEDIPEAARADALAHIEAWVQEQTEDICSQEIDRLEALDCHDDRPDW